MLKTHPKHGRYTLRPVEPDDFDFLWQLKVATLKPYIEKLYGWDEQHAQAILRKVMVGAHLVLVDDEPAGILKVEFEPSYVHLAEIGLMPDHQGRGLGTQILNDVIAMSDDMGLPIELQVFSENRAARLYQRLGFGVTHHKMFRRVSPERT